MIMSTTTLTGARPVAAVFHPDIEHSVIEARMRRAELHARPFLARASDADLSVLGFGPGEIAAIRAGNAPAELVKL